MTDPSTIASPCIRQCTLDDATLICVGCLRHLDEIVGWQGSSPERKREILAVVEVRRIAREATRAGVGR